MIILTSTDKIQVKLAATVVTNQLECYVSFKDTTSTTISIGRNISNTNNSTAVDLVDSPASSTQRVVDYLSIFNSDTTTATVTVQFDISGTPYILTVATLLKGEKLEYQEGSGFRSLNDNGAIKNGNEIGYHNLSGLNYVSIGTDVVNNNAIADTIQDITGLSFAVSSGKSYWFRFIIPYTAAVSTTGARFSLNGPATSVLNFSLFQAQASTSRFTSLSLTAYDTPTTSNVASPASLSGIGLLEGIVTFSAGGTVIGRFASEVANSAITVRAGAVAYYKQLD